MESVAASAAGTTSVAPRRFAPWLVLAGALAIPCLYLPTLGTRFDFIDDGNLVYPAPPMPIQDRLDLVWRKVVANYDHLGPFRPVLWAHWELAAELFQADSFHWRLARWLWSCLAAAAMLALVRELRLRSWPALFATALAFWNPYRNEIWTSLSLSEGVAMPYALGALFCAARASRRRTVWYWDLLSALGILAALGCKNVFAALVPAQVYLRMYAADASWRDGLRRHGVRAGLLALTLLFPVAHYAYFRLNWHTGQYPPTGPTLAQLGRLLRALQGALSLDFVGAGMAMVLVALFLAWYSRTQIDTRRYRVVWIAGGLLAIGGILVYLPLDAMSGRYSMPAVWGLDLMIAGTLSLLAAIPSVAWRRSATIALTVGLLLVALANAGRQDRFAARADLLWQALERVEQSAGPAAQVAWHSGPDLNIEEGIHFRWHLSARGRNDIGVSLYNEQGRTEQRCELPTLAGSPHWAVTGGPRPPAGGPWALQQTLRREYWLGRRRFDCYLWSAAGAGALADRAGAGGRHHDRTD